MHTLSCIRGCSGVVSANCNTAVSDSAGLGLEQLCSYRV